MYLIIQIPCYNEADSLPEAMAALPSHIPGIDKIEILVIDDGSRDDTDKVAKSCGAHHIVRHRTNRGLAAAFRTGLEYAIREGADFIVNTDADNQYEGRDIPKLVEPLLLGHADIVVGDRGVGNNAHFGFAKRKLQLFGSAVVKRMSRTDIGDAVSGFRAMTRYAAERINITSDFSYTTEMLIQAGRKRLAITSVPVRTNGAIRPSRLFTSVPQFIGNTGTTMIRAYAMYNPLRIFVFAGMIAALIGAVPIFRFLYFVFAGDGSGHIQSLVIGGSMIVLGIVAIMFGVVADLVGRNRRLLEQTLERLHTLEDIQRSKPRASENSSVAADLTEQRTR